MKLLWRVFSIHGPKSISRQGMNTNTENRAKKIALMRQMPISGPSRNCMNSMATSPPTVVRLLAPISGMPLLRAWMTASRSGSVSCSSLKRLQRITA